jgi:hypothetical protein
VPFWTDATVRGILVWNHGAAPSRNARSRTVANCPKISDLLAAGKYLQDETTQKQPKPENSHCGNERPVLAVLIERNFEDLAVKRIPDSSLAKFPLAITRQGLRRDFN